MDKFGRPTYAEHTGHLFDALPHVKVEFEIENCPSSGSLGVYIEELLQELKRGTNFDKKYLDRVQLKNLKIIVTPKVKNQDCLMCKYGDWP